MDKEKLGYTWYPKDWGNSDGVFELNLSERGFYREIIDLAMLSDNKTEIKIDIWSRKFNCDIQVLNSIIEKLILLKLAQKNGNILFVQSCEKRLNLIRGGSKGGKISKPTPKPFMKKPEALPEALPEAKETKVKEIEIERESENLPPNFFYIGTEIYKMPVSKYIKTENETVFTAWIMQNKDVSANVIFEILDKDVGKTYGDHNHPFNFFKSTYRDYLKQQNKFNKPEIKQVASSNYGIREKK